MALLNSLAALEGWGKVIPLFPFQFVIVMDTFSRMIVATIDSGFILSFSMRARCEFLTF